MTVAEISPSSTMAEVLEAYPAAQRAMMRKYHIGGCSSCGFAPDDKLSEVLQKHNVLDADEVISHIKTSQEQEERLQISPQELESCLRSESPPKLIDVRGDDERAMVSLEGSLQGNQELVSEMMASWEKDTPIVTYCHLGMRSLEAASYFLGHGFTNVRSLRGGIDAWSQTVDTSLRRY